MRAYLEPIRDFLENLNKRQFYYFVAATLGIVILVAGFLIYRMLGEADLLYRQMANINQKRQEARVLLAQNQQINEYKTAAEQLLARDKNYKLLEGINELLARTQLENKVRNKNLLSADAHLFKGTGYMERQVELALSGINTQQMVQLLEAIENNQRLFVKKLTIVQPQQDGPLDVTLVIATLEQRIE